RLGADWLLDGGSDLTGVSVDVAVRYLHPLELLSGVAEDTSHWCILFLGLGLLFLVQSTLAHLNFDVFWVE
ncbi:hypothetical protein Dimus_031750, partial [Dionaea muscipula]